jgi:hypothetical protein
MRPDAIIAFLNRYMNNDDRVKTLQVLKLPQNSNLIILSKSLYELNLVKSYNLTRI